MTFSDYTIADRVAQLLNMLGAHPRCGVRHLTVQRGGVVESFYQVISLP